MQGTEGKRCLDVDESSSKVVVNECDSRNPRMKWLFGNVNTTIYSAQSVINDEPV